ncbi:hypothetical protein HHK36_030809 [Tetracentron sinense]|uniref:RCK N-terminal domain-containing protein n=1 Tax=Tetracentron sinense TaxID=13715 RepID=A0A834YCC7_TETSI|nr:hypothetical protein HHK36_030809 [Tetracentron sinense]
MLHPNLSSVIVVANLSIDPINVPNEQRLIWLLIQGMQQMINKSLKGRRKKISMECEEEWCYEDQGKTPFEIVYGRGPRHTIDLVTLPKLPRMSSAADKMAERIVEVHADVQKRLEETNAKYKEKVDQYKHVKVFKEGDMNLVEESIWPMLATESLKALGGLGLLSLGGKFLLRRIFEVVAETRSSEAFVALCLLTVAGTSLLTQKLGFSDTLGAFLAGALLAETNFRTQIEADIRPFRGLLLGLFFVTTGTSIDTQILFREWPNVLSLLAGLIVIKTLIITAIGPRVGLTLQESVRIGLLLSQGGEFGFVVFSLANRLGVLPLELNKLLIIVVVLSMALTPLLNEVGRKAADFIDEKFDGEDVCALSLHLFILMEYRIVDVEICHNSGRSALKCKFDFSQQIAEMVNFDASEPVVILGFGQMGQVLANFLSTPLASGLDGDLMGWPYVAFDIDPAVVKASRKLGFPILYGDGSRPAVLQTAGISSPKAVMIMYTGKKRTTEAVQRIRLSFPAIPIYARAQDLAHLLDLKKAGATDAILENAETSLQLGSKLLKGLGVMSDDVTFLSQLLRDSMELQAQDAQNKCDDQEYDVMKPLQVRVADIMGEQMPISPTSPVEQSTNPDQPKTPHILTFKDAQLSNVRGEADQSEHESSLQQSEDLEAKGILYCELDSENR